MPSLELEEGKSSSPRAYRKRYEKLFAPVGQKIASLGITENQMTLLSVLMAILTGCGFALGYFGYSQNNEPLFFLIATIAPAIGIIGLILTSLTDMLDGSIARARGKVTPFGTVLDHTVDRYAEALIFLGIMIGFVYPEWVFFTFFGMIAASYVRAKAESAGGLEHCSVGIAERKEKLFIVGLGAGFQIPFEFLRFLLVLPGFPFNPLNAVILAWPRQLGPLGFAVLFVGIISHISAFQRLLYARKQIFARLSGI